MALPHRAGNGLATTAFVCGLIGFPLWLAYGVTVETLIVIFNVLGPAVFS